MNETKRAPRGLVIEGVECAGKTTLIREFRDQIVNWDCKALAHRPGNQFDRYIREYIDSNDLILNRSHFSERVYSRLWDREHPFSPAEDEVLDGYVARHFTTVLCTADPEALERRYEARRHSQLAKATELGAIAALFEAEFKTVPHIRYRAADAASLAAVVAEIRSALCLPRTSTF